MPLYPSAIKTDDPDIVREAEAVMAKWGATKVKCYPTRSQTIIFTGSNRGGRLWTAYIPVTRLHRKTS